MYSLLLHQYPVCKGCFAVIFTFQPTAFAQPCEKPIIIIYNKIFNIIYLTLSALTSSPYTFLIFYFILVHVSMNDDESFM